MPQRAKASKVMKGRAITAEEFERMLEKVPAIVATERAASWQYLLTGLWWSGLRISEAIELTWDGNDLRVEKSDNYYILRIPAESQKSNEEQVLPIAPEFNKMLREVPLDQQTGFVFNVPTRRGETRRVDTVSKIICKIGEAAMIKVSSSKRNGKTVLKWASAHDLRRAFGTRWAALISPNDLQTLMRHSDFKTTQKFYITQDAKSLTERLEAAAGDLGNTLGNTNANPPETKKPSSTQSVSMKDVRKLPVHVRIANRSLFAEKR